MIIKDFDRQSVLTPAEVAGLVKKLPKAHLQGLRTLLYKPAAEFLRLEIPVDLGCKGAFYPEFYAIVVFDTVSRAMAPHIIYHEIGHYVFHRVIDSYLKKEWVTQIYPRCGASTRYGERNPIEDFAETYALYAQNPADLAGSSPKSIFMRQKVFRGA